MWADGDQGLVNFIVVMAQMRKSRENLKLVSMMSLKKWNKNFRLYIPSGEKRNTFQTLYCSGKFFTGTNPKTLSCSIYFLKGFFRNGLQMANQPCLRLGKGSYFKGLYYYMRNFCNLIGLEQWYFSFILKYLNGKITNLLRVVV